MNLFTYIFLVISQFSFFRLFIITLFALNFAYILYLSLTLYSMFVLVGNLTIKGGGGVI
jgi:hypothetical protein